MLRFDRREVAAVGREDAVYLQQPLGDGDDGGIDETDVCIVVFFKEFGDPDQILRGPMFKDHLAVDKRLYKANSAACPR